MKYTLFTAKLENGVKEGQKEVTDISAYLAGEAETLCVFAP